MGFKKFADAEKVEPVGPEGAKVISAEMQRVGKASVQELTDDEKQTLQDKLTSQD
jgi:hypothetical protein